jgi:hypothetical protein
LLKNSKKWIKEKFAMSFEIHNFIWEEVRLVQVDTQPHHITGVLAEIRDVLDNYSDSEWEDIHSAYYECEQDGTITFYESESAEEGNPGIWTYVVYECDSEGEGVISNPKINAFAPLQELLQRLEGGKKEFKLSFPATELIPLSTDLNEVVRVGKTRVTLDTVVLTFLDGVTAEEIVQQYPSLQLADVYSVISYYLRHQREVDTYLQNRQNYADRVRRENERRFNSTGIREKLLARRKLASVGENKIRKAAKNDAEWEGSIKIKKNKSKN